MADDDASRHTLQVDQLVATACESAGSDDFGGDTWREGLEVLVHCLNTEAALNELGVGAMSDQIVGYLVNRLQVEQWYAQAPRDRRTADRGAAVRTRPSPNRVHRVELLAGAGSGPAVPAGLGSRRSVPATGDGD